MRAEQLLFDNIDDSFDIVFIDIEPVVVSDDLEEGGPGGGGGKPVEKEPEAVEEV